MEPLELGGEDGNFPRDVGSVGYSRTLSSGPFDSPTPTEAPKQRRRGRPEVP